MSTTPAPHEAADAHHPPAAHDQAAAVAHAWTDFRRDIKFFAGFLTIILLTVAAFNINFGSPWNFLAELFFAAARAALIAFFFLSMVGNFSLLARTFVFTALFFAGMVFLSLWDSTVPSIGNPIQDHGANPMLDNGGNPIVRPAGNGSAANP
jgi:hypothetical protein